MYLRLVSVTLLVALKVSAASGPTTPYLELYDGKNEAGVMYYVTGNMHDLDGIFNDRAESFCGVGLWFLYEDKDFSWDSDWVVEFAESERDCRDFDPTDGNQLSSLRLAGTDDIYQSTLTLYEHPYYSGMEYLVLHDIDYLVNFNDVTTSMAVTGNSSWTIYEHPNYSGTTACLVPTYHNGWYYGVWDVSDVAFPDNDLTGIKKGCHSDRIFRYQPKERK